MINILYEDNHLLVVEKNVNKLVQSDNTKDSDLLTELKLYIKKKYNKPGNVYLGLVHRLDRPVGGIMVFARTSKAADRLRIEIESGEFHKTYLAVVQGKVKDFDVYEDYLIKNEKTHSTYISKNGKYSKLEYNLIDYKNDLSLVKINLYTGRHHQIRVQFASRNHPLYGDQRYNKYSKVGEQIALFAYKLEFIHPVTKDKLSFTLLPKNDYPWNLFNLKDLKDGKI